MKRYKITIAILLWLLSLTIVALVSSRIATIKVKDKYDPFTIEEIVSLGGYWSYATAEQYSDGGSYDLGFHDQTNSLFIYLRIDYSLGVEHEYRKFYIRKGMMHERQNFIEVVRGSDLENKVINLVDRSFDLNTESCKSLPDKEEIVALLKSRDLNIMIDNPRTK